MLEDIECSSMQEKIQNIRTNWEIADKKRDENLKIPENIKAYYDIPYGLYEKYGELNLLDIYVQKNVDTIQPTIVNVHGGAWVYGSKEVYKFYCMSLAERGFTVVNINYRLAPEHIFPAPLEDLNNVLRLIAEKGEEYYIDKNNVILVGDSAGAQIVSHYAGLFTNPDFMKLFGYLRPAVSIRALGLNCGLYDARAALVDIKDDMFMNYAGIAVDINTNTEIKTILDEKIELFDLFKYINSNYPPSFIMTTECDFLKPMAEPMYKHLLKNGVKAYYKVYGAKDKPEIGHVFHINCNLKEAVVCNDEECEFFRKQ